jgi:hypothetical protein
MQEVVENSVKLKDETEPQLEKKGSRESNSERLLQLNDSAEMICRMKIAQC